MRSLRFGSPGFVVKVEAGRNPQDEALYACSLRGEGEARITGLVAARAAEGLLSGQTPAGVFHLEQIYDPMKFIGSLPHHGMHFEESTSPGRA